MDEEALPPYRANEASSHPHHHHHHHQTGPQNSHYNGPHNDGHHNLSPASPPPLQRHQQQQQQQQQQQPATPHIQALMEISNRPGPDNGGATAAAAAAQVGALPRTPRPPAILLTGAEVQVFATHASPTGDPVADELVMIRTHFHDHQRNLADTTSIVVRQGHDMLYLHEKIRARYDQGHYIPEGLMVLYFEMRWGPDETVLHPPAPTPNPATGRAAAAADDDAQADDTDDAYRADETDEVVDPLARGAVAGAYLTGLSQLAIKDLPHRETYVLKVTPVCGPIA